MQDKDSDAYLLPFDFSTRRLINRLSTHLCCETDPAGNWEDVMLDSFDWRLHAAGRVLYCRRAGKVGRLLLYRARDCRLLDTAACAALPAWPVDVSDARIREQLAGPLEMRMLLPQVLIDCRYERLRILNDDDKTVARLQVERRQVRADSDSEARTLLPRVQLLPVKGYSDVLVKLRHLLEEVLELPAAPPCVYREALAAIGREAGDYSSRLNVRLTPGMTTLAASRRIFRHLLQTLEANVAGTQAGVDSEFLHDLRVATRRTRSALSQIKGVFAPDTLTMWKGRFGWLGQVTGPLRDIDVFLLTYPEYRDQLPQALRPALLPLHDYLEQQQKAARITLRRHLKSKVFKDLLLEWKNLNEPAQSPDGGDAPEDSVAPEPVDNRGRPAGEVASKRIWKMYRAVLKEGRAISDDTPPEMLHDLRKSCKKLRYLMEFFSTVYDAGEIKALVKETKRLLDNLGEFQDLEVQADKLKGFAQDMQTRGIGDFDTQIAIGALVGDLLRRQEQTRREFADRFATFDSKANHRAYARLFRPQARAEPQGAA